MAGMGRKRTLAGVPRHALGSLVSQEGHEFRGVASARSETLCHFPNGPTSNLMPAIFTAGLLHGQGTCRVARSFEGGHDLMRIGGWIGFGAQVEVAGARGRSLQLILPLRAGR